MSLSKSSTLSPTPTSIPMSTVTLKGSPTKVAGHFPANGETAKDFSLVGKDLSEKNLASYADKKKVLSIFPSVDTPTCATSVKTFNKKASDNAGAVVLCISSDLPFAQARFCGAEGLSNVETLSTFRSKDFHDNYGVNISDGPLRGLTARAVIVLDKNNKVLYSELVSEIGAEPNYDAALAALN